MKTSRQVFLDMIDEERNRQIQEWGHTHDSDHFLEDWTLLLIKHVGKLAAELLETKNYKYSEQYWHRLQIIAALATAAFEYSFGDPESE